MERLRDREHDFGSKLRQASTIVRLKEYVSWQRCRQSQDAKQPPPDIGPISINLDVTSACNFACPHCVDSRIINTGEHLRFQDITQMLDVLQSHGLLSVILVGGGEPTLHKDFEEIVMYTKNRGLQLGIVTNGSRLDKVAHVAGLLEKKDWVRISIDAGTEETFVKSHRPKINITLSDILRGAREVKSVNSSISLGYSFVIVWKGITVDGNELVHNIDEMAEAVQLARGYSFDYVSFKPCLIRLEDSQKESLLHGVEAGRQQRIVEDITSNLQTARSIAGDHPRILESVNLRAMVNKQLGEIKKQPKQCHMQFFRTVATPSGVFHCPAFRGVEKAKIADSNGYVDEVNFNKSLNTLAHSIATFDAEEECKVVGCFYHHVNWWISNLIDSKRDVAELEEMEDDNFFL